MPNKRSLAPWLSVRNSAQAVKFYQAAFSAAEVYRLEDPDGNVIARLSIDGNEFWASDEAPEAGNFSPQTLGGGTMRMILIVDDPALVIDRAINAGASQVYPLMEEHGWQLGRIVDPYGHHWGIGHPIAET